MQTLSEVLIFLQPFVFIEKYASQLKELERHIEVLMFVCLWIISRGTQLVDDIGFIPFPMLKIKAILPTGRQWNDVIWRTSFAELTSAIFLSWNFRYKFQII